MAGTGTRVDMHVKMLDEAVVERAKTRGIDVLVYAPHFTRLPEIRARAKRYSDDDLTVVPAREVFTGTWRNRAHVLAVGLRDPVPDFITLDGAMREFDRQDAAVLAPHPEFLTVSVEEADIDRYRERIDTIETYNPKHLPAHNRRARELADAYDIAPFASSYAHLPGTVGEVWTTFADDIESESDLVTALQTRANRAIDHRSGLVHTLRCRLEFAHLGWENTYGKVDRLLLSGMEPTHPRHIAYDGAFDDVRVY